MGTSFSGLKPKNTYQALIKIGNNTALGSALKQLSDGQGNDLPIQVSTSRIVIGGGSSLGRLVVRGDGTNPIVKFEDNAGIRFMSVASSGSATSIGFNSNQGQILNTDGSGIDLFYGASRSNGAVTCSTSGISLSYYGVNKIHTSGTVTLQTNTGLFAPTSGTGVFNTFLIDGTINQTGGANGIVRGIHLNQTVTAAADYRAIDVSSGTVVLAASVAARSSLRIPSGTAPSTPVDGDIWFNGTNIFMRIGGVTRTFTLT